MILDGVRRRSRGPATDNADTIDVIDTGTNQVVHRVKTTAPDGLLWGRSPVGSSPNSLALSAPAESGSSPSTVSTGRCARSARRS